MDLALTSAGGAMAPAGPELSERERQYLAALPAHIRLLPRMRPDIEQRLEQLNIVAQRDGLLVLTAKGRSLLRHTSAPALAPALPGAAVVAVVGRTSEA